MRLILWLSEPLRYDRALNHVANRLGMKRAELIEKVLADTGIDLNYPENESDLMRAFDYFESL